LKALINKKQPEVGPLAVSPLARFMKTTRGRASGSFAACFVKIKKYEYE